MIATENLEGVCGIYCAIHRDSLSCYVGSSTDMRIRRQSHIRASLSNGSKNAFHKAVREYGCDEFDFEVLERCGKDDLRSREDFWISFLGSAKGSNFNTCSSSSWKGISDRTGERIGNALRGKPKSEEHRRKMSENTKSWWKAGLFPAMSEERKVAISVRSKARKGKYTPETLEKMRLVNIGRKHTDETKRKISESNKGKRLGKKMSADSRSKISLLKKGVKLTREARLKMSESHKARWAKIKQSPERFSEIRASLVGKTKGMKRSEETKQKMRLSKLGTILPDSVKEKMSIAQKARWAIVNGNNFPTSREAGVAPASQEQITAEIKQTN